MNENIDSENKNPPSTLVSKRKAIKKVSSDTSHIFLLKYFRYNLTLVGENYFGLMVSFTEMELFWISVILGI